MVARGRVENGVVILEGGVRLPEGQKVIVLAQSEKQITSEFAKPHSVLDILPVSLGTSLRPLTADDDLFDEMLEGRL